MKREEQTLRKEMAALFDQYGKHLKRVNEQVIGVYDVLQRSPVACSIRTTCYAIDRANHARHRRYPTVFDSFGER